MPIKRGGQDFSCLKSADPALAVALVDHVHNTLYLLRNSRTLCPKCALHLAVAATIRAFVQSTGDQNLLAVDEVLDAVTAALAANFPECVFVTEDAGEFDLADVPTH